MPKFKYSNATFWVIFKQCVTESFPKIELAFLWYTGVQWGKRRSSAEEASLLFSSLLLGSVSSYPTAFPEHPNVTMACDSKCQAQILANAKKEEETENIVIAITFVLIICLVYITGFIVWVWCNRIPNGGISAVPQTDRVAQKANLLASGRHTSNSKVIIN